MNQAGEPDDPRSVPTWRVVVVTALAYALVGWLSLTLAVAPSYATPLFPSAGLGLAAALVYGRRALPGVALGSFLVNAVLSTPRGQIELSALGLPALIGIGAMLEAGAGAALLRRFVPQPLVLATPREIGRSGLLGGALACVISCTLATAFLRATGVLDDSQVGGTWFTWWVGDTLGVLIGAPLALTLIGRPRADWVPRRRTVALPLLAATLLLGFATLAISRWDNERVTATFQGDTDRLFTEVDSQLRQPLDALQAVNSAYLAAGGLGAQSLGAAARWWLHQPMELQALGYGEVVARADITAYEARARAAGLADYRVHDRAGADTRGDAVVLALRLIEPMAGNEGALGVNALSVPQARVAIERSRDSGEAVAAGSFLLSQSRNGETGTVVYQAVYAGTPDDVAGRRAAWRGVVFVTLRADRLLAHLDLGARHYLHWCLVDHEKGAAAMRMAGAAGCEREAAPERRVLVRRYAIDFASRAVELRVSAPVSAVPGNERGNAWLFSVGGMLAAALLGALLLTVTGRARRIELAVATRTVDLQREVHERSQAEQQLRDSEARLRSILDNVPIGVMFLDVEGRIVETNPRLCRMLGRSATMLLGSTLDSISHPDECAGNHSRLAALLDGDADARRQRMRLVRADGHALQVHTHLSVLRDDKGVAQRIAGVVEDITEHLRLEQAERARDRAEAASRAKSEFVSRMSHELRTPLNAMIGFAQLLALDQTPALSTQQHDWVGQIQRAGWHLLEMINDTLDLARIESGAVQFALKAIDPAAVAGASLAMLGSAAAQRQITLHSEFAPEALAVLGDETRLKQVLTNLLSNAVKYNREGGSVLVTTADDGQGFVEIAVRDNGLGMTAEQMAALFQPYNRLGRESGPIEGTGIGLVISRRLAEMMGGNLEASSVAGQGSVFTLRLPRAQAAADTDETRSRSEAALRRRRIHYIEDNETNIEVMRAIVAQRPNFELAVSLLGLDGLAAVRRERPDLILLDMQLPDINGLELLRHMEGDDELAAIPVIVVSADATTARMQEALTLGATRYVTKPVDIASFLQVLDETLDALDSRWGA